ncbi:hypothetical protein [Levilactobacillus paucivorans]|nr:hypothetical protein [Levilactobacillus paucivorans]
MFKLKRKSTLLLMLLGAVVGSLGVTNASAETARIVNTGKRVDNLIHKVDIRKLSYLGTLYDYSTNPITPEHQNPFQTYKLKEPLKLTNESRHKVITLPKGSVVSGLSDGHGNLIGVNNPSLSIKNQKKVFKTLGNWNQSYLVSKNNGGAKHPYTRNTAFSYNSLASFPFLSVKSNKPAYNGYVSLPFISVSADSQLVYHTKGSKFKPTRYAKIKKFKRTHSTTTYYLSKPIRGIATKKVKSGKSHLYRVTFKMGHVFQMMFADNDTDGYNLTINNGKQEFFFYLGDLGWKYIGSVVGLTGANAVPAEDAQIATDYIQGLY